MKKILSTISIFLITITIILCFPISAKADDDLIIPDWIVDAKLMETGDLKIVEDLSFEFNDDFNGVFREILLAKTSGVSDIQVEEVLENSTIKYTQVEDAHKGNSEVFLIHEDDAKINIQIFSPSEDQIRTYRISYTINNVAIKYNDIGELYYKFLGDENETPIKNFLVNIHLPQADTENVVEVFAHGPLNGEIGKSSDTSYFLQVSNVPSNTFVEGRVLFPREFIPLSNRVENKDNYENIIEEEASYQQKIIEDRKRREAIGNTLEQISIITSILGIMLFIIFLILFRRQIDHRQTGDYTKVPEECTPAIASLLTSTLIQTNTIFATMLDLCRKGYLVLKADKEEQNIDINDDKFTITQSKPLDNGLLNHERHFIHWFINEIGNGISVSTNEIESYGKENSTKSLTLYTEWKKKIKQDAVNMGYYDKSKTKFAIFFVLLFLPLLALGIFTIVYGSLFGIGSLVLSLILFIYGLTLFDRLSDYGYQQYTKWRDFKKYMKYSKEISSIRDISKYPLDISLIYSLSLGVQKPMEGLKIDKSNNQSLQYNNSWMIWYFLFLNNKNNTFQKSIDNSFGGSSSSYSGGGGFSAGGGGGAGGGGAGGF
jgi:uncharacterized membrane protein